jgi:hypothetical protein
MENMPDSYSVDKYGFIHQIEHDKFEYTIEYCDNQSTNIEMCYLRLGFLSSFFKYEDLKKMEAVDIGCGNGQFVSCCQGKFKRMSGYDVVGDSISREELLNHKWDLVVLTDVLEHFEDMDELFSIKWDYALISYPETPEFSSFDEIKKWRHFKPNEHLHYLNRKGMSLWLEKDLGITILGETNCEDLIRTRWQKDHTNINTLLLKRSTSPV